MTWGMFGMTEMMLIRGGSYYGNDIVALGCGK